MSHECLLLLLYACENIKFGKTLFRVYALSQFVNDRLTSRDSNIKFNIDETVRKCVYTFKTLHVPDKKIIKVFVSFDKKGIP